MDTFLQILHTVGAVLGYVVFYAVLLAGLVLVPIGLPGTWLMLAAALVFVLATGGEVMSWTAFFWLLGLAIVGEILEAAAGMGGAGAAKGSIWSAVAACVGGLAGALAGSAVAPVVGSIAGGFLGTFLGAYLAEYTIAKQRNHAGRVAKGAVIGKAIGIAAKLGMGVAMLVVITIALIRG